MDNVVPPEHLPTRTPISTIATKPIAPGQKVLLVTCHALACEIVHAHFRKGWEDCLVPRAARHFVSLLHGTSCGRFPGVFLGTALAPAESDVKMGLFHGTAWVEQAEPVAFDPAGTPFATEAPLRAAGSLELMRHGFLPRPANFAERLWRSHTGWPSPRASLMHLGPPDQRWSDAGKGCELALSDLTDREILLVVAYAEAPDEMDLLRCVEAGADPALLAALKDDDALEALRERSLAERNQIAYRDRAILAIPVPYGETTTTAIARLAQTFNGILARIKRRHADIRAHDAQLPRF